MLARRAIVLKKGRVVGNFSIDGDTPRDFFSRQPVEEELIRALTNES